MVSWDVEKEIWARAFKSAALTPKGAKWDPGSTGLLLTEPIFNFPAVQAATEEVRRPVAVVQAARRAAAVVQPARLDC